MLPPDTDIYLIESICGVVLYNVIYNVKSLGLGQALSQVPLKRH